jgi:hypothetical protein
MGLTLKVLTAALSIAVGMGVGMVWFVMARACERFHPQDVRFYFNLYTEIGAATGFFSWYMTTRVHGGHVRLGRALVILAIPFFLIFLLSLGENPFTAFVVVVLFTLAIMPSCAIALGRRNPDVPDRCCEKGDESN